MSSMPLKHAAFAGFDLYLRIMGYAIEADSKTMYDALRELVRHRISTALKSDRHGV